MSAELHNALTHAERSALLMLSVHGLLLQGGHADLARALWVAYQEGSDAAEALGDMLGVEVMLT